jgi:nicotinate dehydrogenase subunit B
LTGWLVDVDEQAIADMPGVLATVRDGSFLGLVATTAYGAETASLKLSKAASWDFGAGLAHDPVAHLETASDAVTTVIHDTLDAAPDPLTDGTALRATYRRSFLAHGSIGTSTAIARWDGDRLTVWSHSQGVFALREALQRMFDLGSDAVRVIHHPNAGCYGHNGADDVAADAALLARAVPGRPVHVVWSREDELAWSPMGSAMRTRAAATTDDEGRLDTFSLEVTSGPHGARPGAAGGVNLLAATQRAAPIPLPVFPDFPTALGGGADRNAIPIYGIRRLKVVKNIVPLHVRTSSLRALGAHANVLAIEGLMDEMAEARGLDPVAFRQRNLADMRARRVLEQVAIMSGWPGSEPGGGRALGIGLARYKNKAAWCAVALDVEVSEDVTVHRAFAAYDAGLVINPDGAANQIEGGILQSLSWGLTEELRFDAHGVATKDWEAYPILGFVRMPTVLVKNVGDAANPPLGVGEASQGPTAGALANAVSRALGLRLRSLPLTRDKIIEALTA